MPRDLHGKSLFLLHQIIRLIWPDFLNFSIGNITLWMPFVMNDKDQNNIYLICIDFYEIGKE